MASNSLLMNMEQDLKCPICLQYVTEPVSVDCGHNFCRDCITIHCNKQEDWKCFLCEVKIQKENFRPNYSLANMVQKMEGFLCQPRTVATCERHNEPLNLFCKEDAAYVCVHCERSPEHRLHTVLLLENAAYLYKDQISKSLKTVKEQRERIPVYVGVMENLSQKQLAETKTLKERTVSWFRQRHQILEEEENKQLAELEEQEKETERKRLSAWAGFAKELVSIDRLIPELEEKQQQSTSELLKDIGSTLWKCESWKIFEDHEIFPPMLNWRNSEIFGTNPDAQHILGQFKESAAYEQSRKELFEMVGGLHLSIKRECPSPDTLESGQKDSETDNASRSGHWMESLEHQTEGFQMRRVKARCLEHPTENAFLRPWE